MCVGVSMCGVCMDVDVDVDVCVWVWVWVSVSECSYTRLEHW